MSHCVTEHFIWLNSPAIQCCQISPNLTTRFTQDPQEINSHYGHGYVSSRAANSENGVEHLVILNPLPPSDAVQKQKILF